MHMRQFTAIFKARTMEFVRDRGTFFWNLLFPIVLVAGFGFAFSGEGQQLFKVGMIGNPPETSSFMRIEQIEFIPYDVSAEDEIVDIVERVRRHQLDMLIDFASQEYYINTESANGPILERLLLSEGEGFAEPVASGPVDEPVDEPASINSSGHVLQSSTPRFQQRPVAGEPIRYVDWVVPGVIGMNMMFSCLFGVGFVIVRYRKNGVLKRLKATPVSALTFVSAQAASRLLIVILTSIVVFAGTNLVFGFMMNGSYLTLLLLTTLAILSMISLGLVFASRIKSEELAGGLLNLVTFPMIILSGVFFSLEGTPEVMQQASRVLPLTHFTEGARAIMLEGAGLWEVTPHLAFLSVITVAFLVLAAFLFRWE